MAIGTTRRGARRSRTVVVVLVIVGLLVLALLASVIWFGVWMTSGHKPFQHSLDKLDLPGEVRLVEHENLGNPLCLDECPMIQREYRSSLDPGATGDAFAATLQRNGFSEVARDDNYQVYDFDSPTGDRCDTTSSEPPRYLSRDRISRTCWVGEGGSQGLLLTIAPATDQPETVARLQIAEASTP
jgi:hypothetical protein